MMEPWRGHSKRAARLTGAVSLAAITLLAPEPALAYHDSVGVGGGRTVHLFALIAIVVAVILVLLSRWQPRKSGRKRAGFSPRPSGKRSRKRR